MRIAFTPYILSFLSGTLTSEVRQLIAWRYCPFPSFKDRHRHAFIGVCGKTRTYAPTVNSRMLFQLSYANIIGRT